MESQPLNKEAIFDNTVRNLDFVTDGLGLEIDPGAKEMIAALNLLGVPTSSSCEGHNEESRIIPPYIQGKALGEPAYRYKGEGKIIEGILRKHSLKETHEIFDDGEVEEEYYRKTDNLEESEEYKLWYIKNAELRRKVNEIVSEYNILNPENRLTLVPIYPGYRVEFEYPIGGSALGSADKEAVAREIVVTAQTAFKIFTDFLKAKYLSM